MDVNFPHRKNEYFYWERSFSSVKRTFSYGQSTVSRLFELYIFLYFAIYEEDTDFRLHIFAYVCQRVKICDSQNAESAKCQKRVSNTGATLFGDC